MTRVRRLVPRREHDAARNVSSLAGGDDQSSPAGKAALDVVSAVPGTRLVPRPETAARVQALLEEMHTRLLAGYAADAVILASAIVEIALRVLAEMPPRDGALGALRRAGRTAELGEVSWVYQLRIAVEALVGQVRPECDADARRASEIAVRLARHAALVTVAQAAACETAAAWQASAPAPSALNRLDRAHHRQALDERLDAQPRVLVVLVHGEVGQGHDHFAEIMTCRLRSVTSGRWREISVKWPPPSQSLGIRLAMLLEALSRHLGVALGAPHDDPTSSDGARAWQPALARIIAGIHAAREPMLLRHIVGCLGSGAGGDDALVDAYVRAVWTTVAQRPGQPVVVSLDLRRLERSGFPLTWAWRHARRDLATARAIERILDAHHLSRGGVCVALPELTSVPAPDLAEWLHDHAGRERDAARIEARQLVASTRGGRFDLVIQRLTAFQFDRHRNPR